jgi:hypothetical protein
MLRCLLAFTLAVASAGAQPRAAKTLTGKWRALETSMGGIGSLLEFHADGSMIFSPGAIVPGKYRVEDDTIISTHKDLRTGQESEDEVEFEIAGDATLRYGSPPVEMTRVGKPVDRANLLLGTWTSTANFDGLKLTGYFHFTADGTELLTIPFRKDPGRYTIVGDTIRIEVQGRAWIEGSLRWEGDVLVLPKPRKPGEMKFKRY